MGANVLTKRAALLGGKLSSMTDTPVHQYLFPLYFQRQKRIISHPLPAHHCRCLLGINDPRQTCSKNKKVNLCCVQPLRSQKGLIPQHNRSVITNSLTKVMVRTTNNIDYEVDQEMQVLPPKMSCRICEKHGPSHSLWNRGLSHFDYILKER